MNKIQGMGGHQLSGIQEHWKQFITWWPETIKWPSNWWRTNWASPVRGFVRFFIKIREQEWPVLYSESRTWTKEVQSHNFHPNMSYQSTLCWLHHYCRRVTGVSAFSQDKISEHRVKNTVITETQNILLAKVKYQNDDHCFWLSVYLNEKQWLLNSMHRWWKSYQCWVKEREAAHDFPEKCICSSLAQCPSLFHRDSEVLPGEQGCAGGQPPTIFQDTDDIKKNLIFMDPCIVVWLSSNNQQDATW